MRLVIARELGNLQLFVSFSVSFMCKPMYHRLN